MMNEFHNSGIHKYFVHERILPVHTRYNMLGVPLQWYAKK